MYKVEMHVKMGEIFTAHANRRSTTLDSLWFLPDGQRVHEDQTPSSLNLNKTSKTDCVPARGVSVAPWLADLNGNSWTSRLAQEDVVFENTRPLAWKQDKMEKQRSNLRRCPQQHPESRLLPRKSFLCGTSMAMTKERQTQQQKMTTRKEVIEARAL